MYHIIKSNKVYYNHNDKNKDDDKDHNVNDDDIMHFLLHCVYITIYMVRYIITYQSHNEKNHHLQVHII